MATAKQPLNLDSVLAEIKAGKKVKERITMIGVDLEGGWIDIPPGARVIRDGSVRGLRHPQGGAVNEVQAETSSGGDSFGSRLRSAAAREALQRLQRDAGVITASSPSSPQKVMEVGEIPSPVMPPSELGVWMRKYYPQAVNETCGLHVHMSFESALHYQRLMVPSYQSAILTYMGKWAKGENLPSDHPLWSRLQGSSPYCQHKFWPDAQIRTRGKAFDQRTEGHRYTVINYCYTNNGTVECRLLPMMATSDQGVRAVQHILDITNAFLSRGRDLEKKVKLEVIASEDTFNLTNKITLAEERRSSVMRG